MMKKISISLIALLLVSCSAPSESKQKPITQDEVVATMVAHTLQPENSVIKNTQPSETPAENSSSLEVDSGLFNVEITIPQTFFMNVDMTTFDPDTYAEENRFKSAVVNEDGSITVKVSKSRHNEMIAEYAQTVNNSFAEIVETTPYITEITSDKHFTMVVMNVEKIGYESEFDLTPFLIGLQTMLYQQIAGIELHCEVTVRDKDTEEILATALYPDNLQQ